MLLQEVPLYFFIPLHLYKFVSPAIYSRIPLLGSLTPSGAGTIRVKTGLFDTVYEFLYMYMLLHAV